MENGMSQTRSALSRRLKPLGWRECSVLVLKRPDSVRERIVVRFRSESKDSTETDAVRLKLGKVG